MTTTSQPQTCEVEWSTWQPQDRATLVFVIRDGLVLLIHKKRGLGAGKINAPGGRLLENETPAEGAMREIQEELSVKPHCVRPRGQLSFQFLDGYSIHAYVFDASDYDGVPTESDEAIPLWVPKDHLPYDQMWEDDRLWLPLLLEGRCFTGRFVFNGDRMLCHRLSTETDPGF